MNVDTKAILAFWLPYGILLCWTFWDWWGFTQSMDIATFGEHAKDFWWQRLLPFLDPIVIDRNTGKEKHNIWFEAHGSLSFWVWLYYWIKRETWPYFLAAILWFIGFLAYERMMESKQEEKREGERL